MELQTRGRKKTELQRQKVGVHLYETHVKVEQTATCAATLEEFYLARHIVAFERRCKTKYHLPSQSRLSIFHRVSGQARV